MYLSIDKNKYRTQLLISVALLIAFPVILSYLYLSYTEKNLKINTLYFPFIFGAFYFLFLLIRILNLIRIWKLKGLYMEVENGYLTIQNRLLFRIEKLDVTTIESVKPTGGNKNHNNYRIILKPEFRGSGISSFIKNRLLTFTDAVVNSEELAVFIEKLEKGDFANTIRL